MSRKPPPVLRAAVPREGAPPQAGQVFSHETLFPGSGSGRYPEGASCPGHAVLPPGVERRDLVSDGKGGWILRGGKV
jgi:hypothetical protein